MKCLSFNCKGLASTPGKLAMQSLIETDPIDIIMLQETLGNTDSIEQSLLTIRPRWQFHALDAIGRAGGLAIGYNPQTIKVSATLGGMGFICMDLLSTELGETLRIINVYGPCQRREQF